MSQERIQIRPLSQSGRGRSLLRRVLVRSHFFEDPEAGEAPDREVGGAETKGPSEATSPLRSGWGPVSARLGYAVAPQPPFHSADRAVSFEVKITRPLSLAGSAQTLLFIANHVYSLLR